MHLNKNREADTGQGQGWFFASRVTIYVPDHEQKISYE
jgi:hypothetical protein